MMVGGLIMAVEHQVSARHEFLGHVLGLLDGAV
jgi:hypothetical protein